MNPRRALIAAAAAAAAAVSLAGSLPAMTADAATPLAISAATAVPGATSGPAAAAPSAAAPSAAETAFQRPPVRHIFVINFENKGFDETFGAGSPAPYLSKKLRAKGQLLSQYFGVAHNSLPNYIAQISGQGPNAQTQADCPVYSNFTGTTTVAPGQLVGHGCVFPKTVRTVANQLHKHGLTWKGYLQSMHSSCRHPALNGPDGTQKAKVGDQYAARHNPFVYFHSIIDKKSCAKHVVPLKKLSKNLAKIHTTPKLSYITPNLCSDAHDSPCVNGRPGGLVSANHWLKRWAPRILASPAFKKNGLLVVTFDEADIDDATDADSSAACCGEGPGPNSPMPGIDGLGGGRTGTLLVSPFITKGSFNDTAYNHYSLLRTIEDLFGLAPLGYAQDARSFGLDVFGKTA
jgi:phosphatidylinositol-3-phosphatase